MLGQVEAGFPFRERKDKAVPFVVVAYLLQLKIKILEDASSVLLQGLVHAIFDLAKCSSCFI